VRPNIGTKFRAPAVHEFFGTPHLRRAGCTPFFDRFGLKAGRIAPRSLQQLRCGVAAAPGRQRAAWSGFCVLAEISALLRNFELFDSI